MALDQRAQAEALVQLAREQQPSIGSDRGSAELDAELRIEREANRARCRVTHWVVPSVAARNPREPRFLRVLSDYDVARSAFKTKMWVETYGNSLAAAAEMRGLASDEIAPWELNAR